MAGREGLGLASRMAVSVTVTVSQYTGNSSTVTPYPTGFAFQESSWLRVFVTPAGAVSEELVQGVDYTVTGAGVEAGGDVTMAVAYPATSVITIARESPRTQLLDLEYNDRLPAQLVEDALDKLTFAVQELANERAVAFPPTEPEENDTVLPDAFARLNCVLGFDSSTGEAVLYRLPVPIVPVSPPGSGTYVLASVDGVLEWKGTVNCA